MTSKGPVPGVRVAIRPSDSTRPRFETFHDLLSGCNVDRDTVHVEREFDVVDDDLELLAVVASRMDLHRAVHDAGLFESVQSSTNGRPGGVPPVREFLAREGTSTEGIQNTAGVLIVQQRQDGFLINHSDPMLARVGVTVECWAGGSGRETVSRSFSLLSCGPTVLWYGAVIPKADL